MTGYGLVAPFSALDGCLSTAVNASSNVSCRQRSLSAPTIRISLLRLTEYGAVLSRSIPANITDTSTVVTAAEYDARVAERIREIIAEQHAVCAASSRVKSPR